MAGGHVHLQWLRRYGATTFVNPGSVGLSYDHVQPDDDLRVDAFAAYARIHVDGALTEVAFRRVPFDGEAVLSAIAASGVPHANSLAAQWR
jgi:hypothetical protein